MLNPIYLWVIIVFFVTSHSLNLNAQSQLTIGTSHLVISGGTVTAPLYLTVDNGNTNALVHNSTGHIITSTEYDRVKWNIGTNTGNFTFPFGVGSTYIPFEYNVTSAGTGAGSVALATWYTLNNSDVPDGGYPMCPSENCAIDRFWTIDFSSYSTNPTSDIRFYYDPTELDGIPEASLVAQRGNLTISCPWEPPVGTVNTVLDYVEVPSVSSGSSPWTLSDVGNPLPIELLTFTAKWKDSNYKIVLIEWVTASEKNNSYFVVQRSADALNFISIDTIDGAGNSNQIIYYSDEDTNPYKEITSYYRLKQVDYNGLYSYSNIDVVYPIDSIHEENTISIFPNPTSEFIYYMISSSEETEVDVSIYDYLGRIVYNVSEKITKGVNTKKINLSQFISGSYIIRIVNAKNYVTQKHFIKNKS